VPEQWPRRLPVTLAWGGSGLGATVGLLLGGQQQVGAAAHTIQHAGGSGPGARQGVGRTDCVVEPGEELVGRGGELS